MTGDTGRWRSRDPPFSRPVAGRDSDNVVRYPGNDMFRAPLRPDFVRGVMSFPEWTARGIRVGQDPAQVPALRGGNTLGLDDPAVRRAEPGERGAHTSYLTGNAPCWVDTSSRRTVSRVAGTPGRWRLRGSVTAAAVASTSTPCHETGAAVRGEQRGPATGRGRVARALCAARSRRASALRAADHGLQIS
jgi:hypothetical protein